MHLLFFYLLEGLVLVFFGILAIIAAPHKEEEDLIIPINEDIDYEAVPRQLEKIVFVSLFTVYALIFLFFYAVLTFVIWGLSELPLESLSQFGLSPSQLLITLPVLFICQGIIYFENLYGQSINQEGDKRQVNIGLYRIIFKIVVAFIFTAFVQVFFAEYYDQYLTVTARIILDIVLILRIRNI